MDILITIIAAIFVLFVPGFVLSLAFFPLKKIDLIERVALSFALSIAVVPLTVFYTNLLGLPITKLTVILQVFGIILISWLVIEVQKMLKNKHK